MRPGAFMIVPVAMFVGLAASCAPRPKVAQHTVADYRADASLRREVFTKCLNDPGGLGQTPDCVNAREAARLESRGSLRDQAPVGLGANRSR